MSVATSSTDVFDIQVLVTDEFDAFPERLRETVEGQHEALLSKLVRRYERGLPLKPKPDFEFMITKKVLSDPKDVYDFQVTRSKRYSDISLANQAILQEFRAKVPKRKSMTMELKLDARKQPMANPALAQRHSVRSGEMSWAFDKFGCLSLYVTNETDSGLRHESIWVERVEPKIVKDPTTIKKDPTTVETAPTMVKREDTTDKARSTATSTAAKVEDVDEECYIVEGPEADKGFKWATIKETTTMKKKTTANKKEAAANETRSTADEKRTPMEYKAPTVTDVPDGDDDDGRAIVDSPNAAK